MLQISEKIKELYPQAHFGVLIMRNLSNPEFHEKFNDITTNNRRNKKI